MHSLHLACDVSTEPANCPHLPFRAASVRRPATAVRFSYGFTGIAASTICYKKLYKFSKIVSPKPVDISLRPLHNPVWASFARFSVDMLSKTNSTAIVESLDIRYPRYRMVAARCPYSPKSHGYRAVILRQPHSGRTMAVRGP